MSEQHAKTCQCAVCAAGRRKRDYRLRLIEATQGNRSILGCVVIAAIGRRPENPPYLLGKALITNGGDVLCDFVDRDGAYHTKARVGDDEDFARNIAGLCGACDLTEAERIEFLARVNNWIGKDERDPNRIKRKLLS